MENEVGAPARWRLWTSAIAAVMTISLMVAGCSYLSGGNSDDTDDVVDAGPGEPMPPPKATVEITYHKPGDTLVRATVTKFFGAAVIANASGSGGRVASVVRFDGGVPIWSLKSDKGFTDVISTFGKANYAPATLDYGKLPAHYQQLIPDEGPPEPLDRGSFYVFTIERASGSTSYQAVKVQADGTLEAYAAQPRAGSSYVMCCNLAADFTEPVVVPEEVTPDESSPDNPDSPDQSPSDSGN